MSFTVIGEDGRRIERGVARGYAQELAARVAAATGEKVRVVEDDPVDATTEPESELQADGVDRTDTAPPAAKGRKRA